MSWLQISFDAPSSQAGTFSELLAEAGAQAVTLRDAADKPVLEPRAGSMPLWEITQVVGLFAGDTDAQLILKRLRSELELERMPPHQVQRLEDQPWERLCMDSFQPMHFGRRLWVCPTWSVPPEPESVNVRLDPGLAFGTGTHPSTELCLRWLSEEPLAGLQVLDYGCGSGILAIAALKLGAEHAWAVDTDSQALEATRRNAVENGVEDRLVISTPQELEATTVAVLIANILAGPLVSLAPRFAARVRPEGRIALSGILRAQSSIVLDAYRRWFEMKAPVHKEEWSLLTGYRSQESSS